MLIKKTGIFATDTCHMELELRIRMNEQLFLRDPEETTLGKKIVRESIRMIDEIGFEEFTFRKLAQKINTTEASVYRYFENKHRLLIYILAWYWSLLEYRLLFHTKNMNSPEKKIKKLIELLLNEVQDDIWGDASTRQSLYQIATQESNKTYLTRLVAENNKAKFYKPYKDLCSLVAEIFLAFNPHYPFGRSLASTLIEMAHFQFFFKNNLPSLTDFGKEKNNDRLREFLESLVFSSIRKRK